MFLDPWYATCQMTPIMGSEDDKRRPLINIVELLGSVSSWILKNSGKSGCERQIYRSCVPNKKSEETQPIAAKISIVLTFTL